jgi:AcrR family transcriptional regulator
MRRDAARNRELLIDAAREVFAQRGLEASLDDIAHHAGLGVGTAYRHFANKWELATALIEQAVDEIVALAERALTLDDPWAGLVAFLEGALEVQAKDRGLREVITGVYDAEQLDRIHDRMSGIVSELFTRGQNLGVIRADADPTDVGFVMTMICSVVEVAGDMNPDVWRRYLAMCLEGLKPAAVALPVAALSDPDFRKAMATHKLGR